MKKREEWEKTKIERGEKNRERERKKIEKGGRGDK